MARCHWIKPVWDVERFFLIIVIIIIIIIIIISFFLFSSGCKSAHDNASFACFN